MKTTAFRCGELSYTIESPKGAYWRISSKSGEMRPIIIPQKTLLKYFSNPNQMANTDMRGWLAIYKLFNRGPAYIITELLPPGTFRISDNGNVQKI